MQHVLRSFIEVAPDSHFPIQNLPFGVFRPAQGSARVGVAIGDCVLDLAVLEERGLLHFPELQDRRVFSEGALNAFMALGRPAWQKTRSALQHLLAADTPDLRDDAALREQAFHQRS